MTDHPAKSCTKRQIDVFEQIATGITNPRAHPNTLNALALKRLIVVDWDVVGRDGFGEIKLPRWHVPLPIHTQWCSWCAEQPEEEVE